MKDICFGVEENQKDNYDWYKDAVVVAFSASDGKQLWKRCYGGTRYDEFVDVEILNSGSVVVAGNTKSQDCNAKGAESSNTSMFNLLLSIIQPTGKEEYSFCDSMYSAWVISQWGNKFFYSTDNSHNNSAAFHLVECIDGEYYQYGKYYCKHQPLTVDDQMYWVKNNTVPDSKLNESEKSYLSICNEDDRLTDYTQSITDYDLNCVFNESIISIQKNRADTLFSVPHRGTKSANTVQPVNALFCAKRTKALMLPIQQPRPAK